MVVGSVVVGSILEAAGRRRSVVVVASDASSDVPALAVSLDCALGVVVGLSVVTTADIGEDDTAGADSTVAGTARVEVITCVYSTFGTSCLLDAAAIVTATVPATKAATAPPR